MKTKRPALQLRDTVQLASHKSVIPAYDSYDGAGVKPFAVVVTDGSYFWHLEPDDIVKVA